MYAVTQIWGVEDHALTREASLSYPRRLTASFFPWKAVLPQVTYPTAASYLLLVFSPQTPQFHLRFLSLSLDLDTAQCYHQENILHCGDESAR